MEANGDLLAGLDGYVFTDCLRIIFVKDEREAVGGAVHGRVSGFG